MICTSERSEGLISFTTLSMTRVHILNFIKNNYKSQKTLKILFLFFYLSLDFKNYITLQDFRGL